MKKLIFVCLLLFVGCEQNKNSQGTQSQEQNKTEEQQVIHLKTTPPPKLDKSQERINLTKRLQRFNTDSKVSYIYLIDYGKVMGFYTVKGKVSSVNSLLTTPDHIVSFNRMNGGDHSVVVASPDLDGSYGTNGDAIFFFTTDDTYVEWSGHYMLCDKPLKMSTPPQLIIETKE